MSVPSPKQAYAFLTPLKSKSSAFILQGRNGNLPFARFMLTCLAALRIRTLILDTSCFYGINAEILTSDLPDQFLRNTTVITLSNYSKLENSLAELVTKETSVILIDDLNALRNLLANDKRNSSIQKLFFLIRILSYEARTNARSILTTVYRSASVTPEKNPKRSLSSAADLQIITEAHSSSLTFSCDDIESWPASKFNANAYFALKT